MKIKTGKAEAAGNLGTNFLKVDSMKKKRSAYGTHCVLLRTSPDMHRSSSASGIDKYILTRLTFLQIITIYSGQNAKEIM